MGYWVSARKGGAGIYAEYGHAFSNNLFAYNSEVWSEGPDLHVRVDLRPNLRGRSKETGTYLDARDLADEPEGLKLVQVDDPTLLKTIQRVLANISTPVSRCVLTVRLDDEHSYRVTPEARAQHAYEALVLHVEEMLD